MCVCVCFRFRVTDFFCRDGFHRVGIRTVHGKYVCADSSDRVVCDRGAFGGWETFSLKVVSMGAIAPTPAIWLMAPTPPKIALEILEHGKATGTFVSSSPDQNLCVSGGMGLAEKLDFEHVDLDEIALKNSQGKYITAQGKKLSTADGNLLSDAQRFKLIRRDEFGGKAMEDQYTIRTCARRFWRLNERGFDAEPDHLQNATWFKVHRLW